LGNRKADNNSSGNWDYNSDNQLTSTPHADYIYDANGNLTSKINKAVNGVNVFYIWNVKGQLLEVKEGVTIEDSATVATYAYDMFGRRISKTANGTTKYFHYNKWGLCGEYDANGLELRSYGYSPAAMAPLFIKQGDEYYYYLNDHLETPQKIISASGRVAWSAFYTAFGKATIGIGSEIENNLRLPGQYFDAESNLHYNFSRYYDVENGRYISADPIGIGGGLNLYTYASNEPVNKCDYFEKEPNIGVPSEDIIRGQVVRLSPSLIGLSCGPKGATKTHMLYYSDDKYIKNKRLGNWYGGTSVPAGDLLNFISEVTNAFNTGETADIFKAFEDSPWGVPASVIDAFITSYAKYRELVGGKPKPLTLGINQYWKDKFADLDVYRKGVFESLICNDSCKWEGKIKTFQRYLETKSNVMIQEKADTEFRLNFNGDIYTWGNVF
jgi:RHS repeat-associated protein